MKCSLFLLLAAGALMLTGCSSTPTKVDTGTIRASTFNFAYQGVMPTADFSENRTKVHTMIQNAITARLTQAGLSRVEGSGDVTVAYLILIANNSSVTAINDYFGYGRDAMALADKAQSKYGDDNDNPNYFEQGALVIDIVDSRSHKLLKRSHAVRPVQGEVADDVRAARIQEAVDEALKNLRIEH